jgi:hypothetical protein
MLGAAARSDVSISGISTGESPSTGTRSGLLVFTLIIIIIIVVSGDLHRSTKQSPFVFFVRLCVKAQRVVVITTFAPSLSHSS